MILGYILMRDTRHHFTDVDVIIFIIIINIIIGSIAIVGPRPS
jgi:hypothetical protein